MKQKSILALCGASANRQSTIAFAVALSALFGSQSTQASDASWATAVNGAWATGSLWTPAASPGATSGTTNADTATFNNVITAGRTITVDANRNIKNINIGSATGSGVNQRYTLSGGSFLLTDGGKIAQIGVVSHFDNIATPITLLGGYTFDNGAASPNLGLNFSNTGSITGTATTGNNNTLTLQGSSVAYTGITANASYNSINAVISNGGNGGTQALSKSGTGEWALLAANTYSGGTTISAGKLFLGGAGTLGSTSGSLTMSGGTLNLGAVAPDAGKTAAAATQTVGVVSITGASTITNGSLTGSSFDATLTTGTATISAVLKGSAPLTMNGAGGTLVLSGANEYTGTTQIQAGTLSVNSLNSVAGGSATSSLGAAPANAAAGTIAMSANGVAKLLYTGTVNETTDRIVSTSGALGNTATIDQSGTAALKFTGNFTVTSVNNRSLILAGSTAGTGEISGVISDSTSGTQFTQLTKSGTGTWTLSGANTYSNNTKVTAGTLVLSNSLAIQNSTLDTTSVTGDATNGLKTTVTTLTMGGLSGAKDLASLFTTTSGGYTGVTALTLNPRATNSYTGIIADGATGMTLTKTGAGTQTLGGANTYTGATLITGGTLALAAGGSIDNSSSVSLGTVGTFDVSLKGPSGYTVGTLTGSGNVTGALSVSTQLAIGNSPGTTNFSNGLTLDSAVYLYDMTGGLAPGAGSADLGNVAGLLTISPGSVLDLVELGAYTVGNRFTLFSYGTLSGTFDGLANNSNFLDDLSNTWQIKYDDTSAGLNGGTGSNFITITAVPEPDAAMLVGGLGVLALLRRRRA